MEAMFSTSRKVIDQAIDMEVAACEPGAFEVSIREKDGICEVSGKAQSVMFLIGRIAGFGEGGLISVAS